MFAGNWRGWFFSPVRVVRFKADRPQSWQSVEPCRGRQSGHGPLRRASLNKVAPSGASQGPLDHVLGFFRGDTMVLKV